MDEYKNDEIERALEQAINRNLIVQKDGLLFVNDYRVTFARQLLIIDIVALIGERLNSIEECSGKILIPGYGDIYAAQLNSVSKEIDNFAPNHNYSRNDFAQDITWLTENKFIILR